MPDPRSITFRLHRADDQPDDRRLVLAYPRDGLCVVAFCDCGTWRLPNGEAVEDPLCWHERATGMTAVFGDRDGVVELRDPMREFGR